MASSITAILCLVIFFKPLPTHEFVPINSLHLPDYQAALQFTSAILARYLKGKLHVAYSTMLTVAFLLYCISVALAAPDFRVTRGEEATPHEFPSIVALQEYISGYGWFQYCSGTLLNANTVVSAGHCLKPTNTIMRIVAGAHRLSNSTGVTHAVISEQIRNPNYAILRDGVVSHDIMIIKLSTGVKETANIKYARLPPTNGETPPIQTNCQIVGWGKTTSRGSGSDVLMKGPMKAEPDLILYGDRSILQARPAGPNNSSGCKGDSGGPLYCPAIVKGERPYITGAVSGGDGACGSRYGLARFARIDEFVNWIHRYM